MFHKIYKNTEIIILILFVIFFTSGIYSHLNKEFLPLSLKITEFSLLITNTIAILFSFKNTNKSIKLILWIFITFILTYFIEVIGVKTGFVFGKYQYNEVFKIKSLEVPLIIAFNWVVLILATTTFFTKINNKYLAPFFSGILIVLLDIAIEPVAIKLGYWHWENHNIPLQNYIAWFIIAYFFSYLMQLFKIKPISLLLKAYFIIQLIFFYSLMLFL
ncbi:MAG: carotenoid biosynthesis protein [Bacteroidales bacterium]|nr:carotenoid biosynthesis protein [Bacteroidales bacterium]